MTILSARFHSNRRLFVALGALLGWLAAALPAGAQPHYTFTTLAGTPSIGNVDGTGSAARFYQPIGVAVDSAGTLYVADSYNSTIRRITPAGVVTTLAGSPGTCGSVDATGAAARFCSPQAIAIDGAGVLWVADGLHTIRRVTTAGVVTTIAGMAYQTGSADGTGSAARFNHPTGIAIDGAGVLWIADTWNNTIRRVTQAGVVTTIAGQPAVIGSVDGTGAAARFYNPAGIAVDAAGNLFVADHYNNTIRLVTGAGVVTTLAGQPGSCGTNVDATGTAARICRPWGLTIDGAGNLFVATFNHTVRKIAPGAVVTTIAGFPNFTGSIDGTGSAARFRYPQGITVDPAGMLYVTDWENNTVRKITPAGVVTTLAGTGSGRSDGTAAAAGFNFSEDIASDGAGTLYVADSYNSAIRKVAPGGIVTTLAGLPGTSGGVNGTGSAARFGIPRSITVGPGGIVYVLDRQNQNVRAITPAGVVTTLAQLTGASNVSGIAVNSAGTVYVGTQTAIRQVSPMGVVSPFVGQEGTLGSANGSGSAARFSHVSGLTLDGAGNLYVADYSNNNVRKVTPAGVVTTVAGMAGICSLVDGTGTAARFCSPNGIAAEPDGTLYVADNQSIQINGIRKISPAGVVTTIAGFIGYGVASDSTSGAVRFSDAEGIAVDARRNVYVMDHNTVRVGAVVLDQSVRPGQAARFVMAGAQTHGFVWQVSTNGGGAWTNVPNTFPYFGANTSVLAVATTVASLSGTQYRCIITDTAGSATSNVGTLTISGAAVNPERLSFGAAKAPGSSTLDHVSPPQEVTVTVLGPSVTWSATPNQTWLQVTGGAGTGSGRFTVSIINPGDVIGGNTSLAATITVTSSDPGSTPFLLPVALTVTPTGQTTGAFGAFDTPADGATGVQGSIAVTGWALDDVEVTKVQIWRDLVAGETTPPYPGPGPGTGKVFIADAFFVEGARPDVEIAFASTPRANRAGWGYLLLTWGLWGQGNGTYRLHAFAFDQDGHGATLGTKTIAVSNASGTRPFGGIDTPSYGQTVSGSFWNYGWALTPNANAADPRNCTITNGNVYQSIDSGPLTPVTYGGPRPDILSGFGTFSNGANSGGALYLDTTPLTNGTHAIGWLVYDSCGRGDGIGSRFFKVLNGTSDAMPRTGSDTGADATPAEPGIPAHPATSIGVRQNRADRAWLEPSPSGEFIVSVEQGGRIEVELPEGGASYAGGQMVNGEQRALPAGSSLDATQGIFYWQPAPGFLGRYDLVFSHGALTPTRVRVVVGPTLRMMVDAPVAGVVDVPFRVSGWALDLAASVDAGAGNFAGIDAVHVWAHPLDGAGPIFVGEAALGGSRPDVAALFGAEFETTAYDVTASRLPPGTYDLVVYARRALTGAFDGAHAVRVSVR